MSYSLMVFVFLIEVIEVEDKHSGRLSMHECADLKKKSWLTFSEGSKMCYTENLFLERMCCQAVSFQLR